MADKFKAVDAKPGDVCWFKVNWQKAFLYGTIISIHENENAVSVMTANNGYRCIHEDNAAWSEAEIKKITYTPPPKIDWSKK